MERQPKRNGERKRIENEELVKYMSSLPSYLKKRGNLQDKAFSVGVLDWRFLKKWRHEHVNVPCKSSIVCSPSSSNTLSVSSMEGSSSNSSRDRSCSSSRRRIHRPTSQSHYASPPKVTHPNVKSGNCGHLHNLKPGAAKFLHENQQRNLLELSKYQHPQRTSRVRRSLDVETETRTSSSVGNMKIQDRECLPKEEDELAESCQVPEPGQETNSCTTYCPPNSLVRNQESEKSNRQSFSYGFISTFYPGQFSLDIPSSCPLPHEADESKMGQVSAIDAKDTSFSSLTVQPSAYSGKNVSSPPRVDYKVDVKYT